MGQLSPSQLQKPVISGRGLREKRKGFHSESRQMNGARPPFPPTEGKVVVKMGGCSSRQTSVQHPDWERRVTWAGPGEPHQSSDESNPGSTAREGGGRLGAAGSSGLHPGTGITFPAERTSLASGHSKLCAILTFTHSCTHSRTAGGVSHAGRRPARREQSG